jgi:hypothetical protein
MRLANRFAYGRKTELRSDSPLSDAAIRSVAPSVYASEAHESRSARYAYIPTVEVLSRLRREGFEPFQVTQCKTRIESRRDFTKHMLRLRHASQINAAEANEIVLLNSHDGTSSYQLLSGLFRFVCSNGLVVGSMFDDIRVKHSGNVVDSVIEGAYEVLQRFDRVADSRDTMRALTLTPGESELFARTALTLKYDEIAAPITESQVLRPRRSDDASADLWTTFNRVQENLIDGGLRGRAANGRRTTTRAVSGIDQNVKLNRALWTLAEEMARLKTAA